MKKAGLSALMEFLTYAVPAAIIVTFGILALSGRTLTIPKAWARLNDRLIETATARLKRLQNWRRTAGDGRSA